MIFFRDSLIQHYGGALQRIAINFYLSCPNRENGGRGCLFCPEDGAQARHLRRRLDLKAQVDAGLKYVQKRYEAKAPYIAYFQSYTNTYADINTLRALYEEALSYAEFKVVMIATRPDCLSEEILDYLQSLTQRYEVWIELGVQTIHDSTLELVERGHDFKCSCLAIEALHLRGIKVAVHLILGLPKETPQMMLQTAEELSKWPIDGIKFHQMMVFKKTPLSHYYHLHPDDFNIKNEYEYAQTLCEMLRRLPENIIIMRLNADAEQSQLIFPHWIMKKGQFKEHVLASFHAHSNIQLLETQDHSFTAYHPSYRQHFHCVSGAKSETIIRFIQPSMLKEKLENASISVLDIGFGLGYNALESLDVAQAVNQHFLTVDSVEKERGVLALGVQAQSSIERKKIISCLEKEGYFTTDKCEIHLKIQDARLFVKGLNRLYDIIYLDGFSPDVNPELWSYDFLRILYKQLNPNGVLCTYSSAYPVIGALIRCGFKLGKTPVFGEKRFGLFAIKSTQLPSEIEPLDEKDFRIAKETLAGVSYRDASLMSTIKQIRQRREGVVSQLKKHQIPKWLKQEKIN